MLELLNIRFSYLCRTTFQNNKGQNPIILRIIFRGERRDIFTSLYCLEKDWDCSATKVAKSEKSAASLNQNLQMILHSAKNSFDEMKFSGETFTIGDLIDKIKGKEDKPTLLIDYLKEESRAVLKRIGSEIVPFTYNKYNSAILTARLKLSSIHKIQRALLYAGPFDS